MNGQQHKAVGIAFGTAVTYVLLEKYNAPASVLVIPFLSAAGSMLPDIDHDRTKIGRKRKAVTEFSNKLFNTLVVLAFILIAGIGILTMKQIVDFGINLTQLCLCAAAIVLVLFIRRMIANSSTFQWACKHRGLMHTLVVPAILYVAMYSSGAPIIRYSFLGLFVGYLSHLLVDMENVGGCPILFPIIRSNIRICRIPTEKEGACNAACFITCLFMGCLSYGFIYYL